MELIPTALTGTWQPPVVPWDDARAACSSEKAARMLAATLSAAQNARSPRIAKAIRYREGQHDSAFDSEASRQHFAKQVRDLAISYPRLIVNAFTQRLGVLEVLFPSDGDGNGRPADDDAMDLWLRNGMQAKQRTVHRTAVTTGEAYVLISPTAAGPVWTCETPEQMIVAWDPQLGRPSAALKQWNVGVGALAETMVTLYLPGGVWKFRAGGESSRLIGTDGEPLRGREGKPKFDELGAEWLPVVPFLQEGDEYHAGQSVIEPIYAPCDAVNKLCRDLMVASDFSALPQRFITGVEAQTDPKTGQQIPLKELFNVIDRFLYLPGKDAKMAQLEGADGTWHVNAIAMFRRDIAAVTQVPHGYLDQTTNPPSADSIDAAEAGLIARCAAQQDDFGPAWLMCHRTSFAFQKDSRADDYRGSIVWKPVQRRSPALEADAFTKLWANGGGTSYELALQRAMQLSDREIEAELGRKKNWPDNPRSRTGGQESPNGEQQPVTPAADDTTTGA